MTDELLPFSWHLAPGTWHGTCDGGEPVVFLGTSPFQGTAVVMSMRLIAAPGLAFGMNGHEEVWRMTRTIGVTGEERVGDRMVAVVWQLSGSEGDAFWYGVTARVRALPHSPSPAQAQSPVKVNRRCRAGPNSFLASASLPKQPRTPSVGLLPPFLTVQNSSVPNSQPSQNSRIPNLQPTRPDSRKPTATKARHGQWHKISLLPATVCRLPLDLESSSLLCFLLVSAVLANGGSSPVLTTLAPVPKGTTSMPLKHP